MMLADRCFLKIALGVCLALSNVAGARAVVATIPDRLHPHANNQSDEAQADQEQEEQAQDTTEQDAAEKAPADTESVQEETPQTDPTEAQNDVDESEQQADQSSDSASQTKEPKKSKVFKVLRKPLKIDAELEGVFVASETEEIALRPETGTQFKVVEAVEHGTAVQKGEVLVRFDDEKLEEALAKEAIDQGLAELALMQLEEQFPRDQRLLEIAYEKARLAHEQLEEDYQYYKETDRPFRVRIAGYRYDSSKEDLASQEEELAQLIKMYAADDLTEETEAIVLRRQRFQVETAKLSLELQKSSHDYTLSVVLPRNDDSYARRLEQSRLQLQQAKTLKEKSLTRARLELQKKRLARAVGIEQHAKLLSDRSLLVLRAPADGVVYYGRCVDGKWSEMSTITTKLQPHSTVSANTVLMTLVKQRPLHVTTKITEKELPDFRVQMEAVVMPTADDDLKWSSIVSQVAAVPDASTKFAVCLDVDLDDAPEWLVAGMTCHAHVTVYENDQAIVIPRSLVQTDKDDPDKSYVTLVDDDLKPVRRDVKLGREKGKSVEVLQGLEEGDRIVKEGAKQEQDEKDEAAPQESKED